MLVDLLKTRKYEGIFHVFQDERVEVPRNESYQVLCERWRFSPLDLPTQVIEGKGQKSSDYYLTQIREQIQENGIPKAIIFTDCGYDVEIAVLSYARRQNIPVFGLGVKVREMASPEKA